MPFLVLIFSCFYFSYFLTFSIFVLVFEKIVVKFPWFAAKNHQSIQCDTCDTWAHGECNKINRQTYKLLQNEKNTKWFCVVCIKGFLPFSNLINEELIHTIKGKNIKFTLNYSLVPSLPAKIKISLILAKNSFKNRN